MSSEVINMIELCTTGVSLISLTILLVYIFRNPTESYAVKMLTHIVFLLLILQLDWFGLFFSNTLEPTLRVQIAQGYFVLFDILFFILAQLWSIPISIHAYRVMTEAKKFDQRKFYRWSVVLVYFLGLAPVGTCIVLNVYYEELGTQLAAIIFMIFWIYLGIGLIISISLYFLKRRFIEKYFDENIFGQYNINIGKLTLYPLFQMLVFSPYLLQGARFYILGLTDDWLVFLQDMLYALNGLMYALFYTSIRNVAKYDVSTGCNNSSKSSITQEMLPETEEQIKSLKNIEQDSTEIDMQAIRMLKSTLQHS